MFSFNHTYAQLPNKLFSAQAPNPVKEPRLLIFNQPLAKMLELEVGSTEEKDLAQWFSGNVLLPNAKPIAQAYAGHQFGYLNMLGDGRAVLLGEHSCTKGVFDIQLKGAGQTPYSRRGDGRATLNSVLREYLFSEALHYLGIPSSRSLAVVATGEPVYRQTVNPGAILTRVAKSHVRVGTFEYATQVMSIEDFRTFLVYVSQRHYPSLPINEQLPINFLQAVADKQIELIVRWMQVGFIHGVMNSDNMFISGETLDFGPCAFMNSYNLKTVFSSIDTQGRYAFGAQPGIMQWNLACLAGALLPLIHTDEKEAISTVEPIVKGIEAKFKQAYGAMLRKKVGLITPMLGDDTLLNNLLDLMEKRKLDYTNTFTYLTKPELFPSDSPYNSDDFSAWYSLWKNRVTQNEVSEERCKQIMASVNPLFVPRNYEVEEVLSVAEKNPTALLSYLEKFKDVYAYDTAESVELAQNTAAFDAEYNTFCGT
ncbi:MAG: protein adenylyltransferase SelO [Luteibaculaceae bacterium]